MRTQRPSSLHAHPRPAATDQLRASYCSIMMHQSKFALRIILQMISSGLDAHCASSVNLESGVWL